jgi:hypothetical protein
MDYTPPAPPQELQSADRDTGNKNRNVYAACPGHGHRATDRGFDHLGTDMTRDEFGDVRFGPPFEWIPDRHRSDAKQVHQVSETVERQRMSGPCRHRSDDLRADWQVLADHAVLVKADLLRSEHPRHNLTETGKKQ